MTFKQLRRLCMSLPDVEERETWGEATYRVEHRVRSPAGRWIWITSDGQVVQRDANGRALRVIGTNKPIDTRKLAEQALRASEEKFARAFQMSPMLMAISATSMETSFPGAIPSSIGPSPWMAALPRQSGRDCFRLTRHRTC